MDRYFKYPRDFSLQIQLERLRIKLDYSVSSFTSLKIVVAWSISTPLRSEIAIIRDKINPMSKIVLLLFPVAPVQFIRQEYMAWLQVYFIFCFLYAVYFCVRWSCWPLQCSTMGLNRGNLSQLITDKAASAVSGKVF